MVVDSHLQESGSPNEPGIVIHSSPDPHEGEQVQEGLGRPPDIVFISSLVNFLKFSIIKFNN